MIPLKSSDKRSIETIFNKSFNPISKKIDDISNLREFKYVKYLEFESFDDLNQELSHQKDWNGKVPIFERSIIRVGDDMYYFLAETWHEDCLESRNLGITNEDTIAELYKEIMIKESGIGYVDKHDYVISPLADFGVSWIARKVTL